MAKNRRYYTNYRLSYGIITVGDCLKGKVQKIIVTFFFELVLRRKEGENATTIKQSKDQKF